MPSSSRSYFILVSGLGAGLFVGTGVALLYYRLRCVSRELRKLVVAVSTLREEVADLKSQLRHKRRPRSGFPNVAPSSGDDDEDIFQDAIAGSDQEASPQLKGDEDVLASADRMFDSGEGPETIYHFLLPFRNKHLTDPEYYCRLVKATVQLADMVGLQNNAERRRQLLYEAKEYASSAVSLGEDSAECHKWYAIVLGQLTEFETTTDKIKSSYVIKEHIEKALKINPAESTCLYMLGRWCYSIYMLTWLERQAAAAFFHSPPTATVEEALGHFRKVEELVPGKWKGNQLYIAKCLLQKSQIPEAVSWLRKAQGLPCLSTDDRDCQKEIQDLLTQYS